MSKKQEALDKAKQQWKKAKEHGENFWKEGKEAIKNTVGALGHTLGAWYEAWTSRVFESREKEEWIPEGKKKEYWKAKKLHWDRAKDHIEKAKQDGKKAIKWWWKALKWWAKAIWHAVKWGYHLIDAWDKAIWEQIEKKQIEKWKRPWKIWRFFRDNIIKLMIVLWATGYWWYKSTEIVKDSQQNKQGIVIGNNNETNDQATYQLSFEESQYFQNPEFFDTWFKTTVDETYKDKWVVLIRDAWMTFYVVQEGETTKKQIRDKLSSISEFSYLKDTIYNDKIKGFNVPDASLKKWLYIPIPVKAADRKIEVEQFREYSRIALHEMEQNPVYWEKTKKLIKECGEEKILNIMIAFARCETATDQQYFSDPIGTTVLHRWEPKYHSFSFSYYHILMEKNADGKTPWPWLKARQNLWLTEWQCYHPVNAWKLFLWYCFEKKKDPTYFFKIRNLEEAKTKWWKYNWDSTYWWKLWDNIQHTS